MIYVGWFYFSSFSDVRGPGGGFSLDTGSVNPAHWGREPFFLCAYHPCHSGNTVFWFARFNDMWCRTKSAAFYPAAGRAPLDGLDVDRSFGGVFFWATGGRKWGSSCHRTCWAMINTDIPTVHLDLKGAEETGCISRCIW